MSRQLEFSNACDPGMLETEMVEINLNGINIDVDAEIAAPRHQASLLGGYKNTDLYFCKKSNSTGQLAEKVSASGKGAALPAPNNISCLRQMYCPACHERLHEQSVRLERLLTLCCFPLLPIYPCCTKRSLADCKVICGKCGYQLGAWKRQ